MHWLRSISYTVLMLVCLALSAPGFALLHLSSWFAVLARRTWPDATWSNCWAWAAAEYAQRKAAWERDGRPRGAEPWLSFRQSRHDPREVRHTLVGRPRYAGSDLMDFWSYVPTDPTEVPLILAWQHAFFKGRVKHSDIPTQPPRD